MSTFQEKGVAKTPLEQPMQSKENKSESSACALPALPASQTERSSTSIKVDLNTPTDFWVVGSNALIGFSGILTAIVVAWITRQNQRSQNKVNLANLRQQWQNKFSDSAARYIGLVTEIVFETALKTDDMEERKRHVLGRIPDLFYQQESIFLMLDKDQLYTRDARAAMLKINRNLKEFNASEVAKNLQAVRSKFNEIHEKAWQDIQRDLKS